MLVRFAESSIPEAERLNYSFILNLIDSDSEVKTVLQRTLLELDIEHNLLFRRLGAYAKTIRQRSHPMHSFSFPLLIGKKGEWNTVSCESDGSISTDAYQPPVQTCVVCGINPAVKKEYQDVSLRADYKQLSADPFNRQQITAVCNFCFASSKATQSRNGVWIMSRQNLPIYMAFLRDRIFGNLAFFVGEIGEGRPPDRQFVIIPLPSRSDIYTEAHTFAGVYHEIIAEDLLNDIRYWCPSIRERDYPHFILAILSHLSDVSRLRGFLIYERRTRGGRGKWSTERMLLIRKSTLSILGSIATYRAKVERLNDDAARHLRNAVMALIDGNLTSYYAELGSELPRGRGRLIDIIFDNMVWSDKIQFEDIRKRLIYLSE